MTDSEAPLPLTSPAPIAGAMRSWRADVVTSVLGVMSLAGAGMLVAFLPGMWADRSYVFAAFAITLVAANVFITVRPSLPAGFRSVWVVGIFAFASVPTAVTGGDRGALATYLLTAAFLATLMFGWRAAATVFAMATALFALVGWGYYTRALPLPQPLAFDVTSPLGFASLWFILGALGAVIVIASELLFRRLDGLLRASQTALAEKERAYAELVAANEQRASLVLQVDLAQAERAKTERALAETLDAVGAGFWELDMRTHAATWSDRMYTLLGYEVGSVAPTSEAWQARTHPEDHAKMMASPLAPSLRSDYRLVLPNGATRWVRSAMQTVFDEAGAPLLLRGLLTDVTDEHDAADRIARLAEVASRTDNAVVVTNLEGAIEWVNDSFTRLTGWELDAVAGKRPGSVLQGPHTDREAVARVREAVAARQPFEVELLNYARDGRQYWVQIEARLALDAVGAPVGYIALESDVTARRVAAARDALAERVAALLLKADTVEEAAPLLTKELVGELDVRAAQMWLVVPGQPHLVYVAGASSAATGDAGEAFLALTKSLPFAAGTELVAGIGIPGKAWGTARSAEQRHLSTYARTQPSRRQAVAAAAGIETFCATPIHGANGVIGVLEIGGTAFYPGHELLPALLERTAEQVASFLRHVFARDAFESVFEHSPDAMLLVNAGGRVQSANARAVGLFGACAGSDVNALLDEGSELVSSVIGAPRSHRAGAGLVDRQARGVAGPFSAEVSTAAIPSTSELTAILAVRDLTERHRMEEALSRSLREKETLLREVHHRVKNNLQIVSSLLTLQAEGLEQGTARDALTSSVYRVRSMSYVHQQLHNTDDPDSVELSAYARTLCTSLQSSLDPSAELAFALERVEVSIDQAIPVGLVLNELITNALKHGRSPDGRCRLFVEVRPHEGGAFVAITDDGPGFVPPRASSSLGMQLVRTLSRQVRGKLDIAKGGTTRPDGGVLSGARTTLWMPPPEVRPASLLPNGSA